MVHLSPLAQTLLVAGGLVVLLILATAIFTGLWLEWRSSGARAATAAEDPAWMALYDAPSQALVDADAQLLTVRLFGSGKDAPPAHLVAEAWRLGAAVAVAPAGRRICRICGCWELNACAAGCWWVAEDLCSQCDRGEAQH